MVAERRAQNLLEKSENLVAEVAGETLGTFVKDRKAVLVPSVLGEKHVPTQESTRIFIEGLSQSHTPFRFNRFQHKF